MRRFLILTLAVAALVLPATIARAGVSGPAFYVDGVRYRVVGTPTDLSGTGAPAHSFDLIYEFFGLQLNAAAAAPGDPGYNGSRWAVHGLRFADYQAAVDRYDRNGSGDLDSDEEVAAALAGSAATDIGVVKSFECPVIPPPRSG
jgi:hypothetical protein